MTKLKYGILCEQAIINRETGQISIINVLNGLKVPELPIEVTTIFLVVSWQREMNEADDDEEFEVRIALEKPDASAGKNKQVANEKFEVRLPKGNSVANTVTQLKVQFTEAGENKFLIEKKQGNSWKIEDAVPIRVIVKHNEE